MFVYFQLFVYFQRVQVRRGGLRQEVHPLQPAGAAQEVGARSVRVMIRADRKSQVGQGLGFCRADFLSSLAYESTEQKPQHCLTS